MKLGRFFLVLCLGVQAEQIPTRKASPNRIIVFVKPYQEIISEPDYHLQRFQKKTEAPGKINRTILKQQLEHIRQIGLCAAYNGFCTVSDSNGEIAFPRMTSKDEIDYVVAQRVRPVLFKGATVHHFIIPPSADVDYFHLQRLMDPEKKYFYWQTTKLPVPTNRRIADNAIIFFAKPEQLIITQEAIITIGGQNLFLPDILVKNTVSSHALLFLKVSKYFSPVKFIYQYTDDRYATLIRPYFAG